MSHPTLPVIPCVDIRERALIEIAAAYASETRGLIRGALGAFGVSARILGHAGLPLGDMLARRWLKRTKNPYLAEIDGSARTIRTAGVHALNLSYEWGCSGGIFHTPEGNRLVRVMDWPFPELGRHLVVLRQPGDFWNVTWPGISTVFQANAPGRFAAAINQAPMRRHAGGIVGSWLKNRLDVQRSMALPPAHLLRQVFETAATYAEAKAILIREPIALPAIYILAGPKDGQGCIIERLENEASVREIGKQPRLCVSNHFLSAFNGKGHGWMPRPIDSAARHIAIEQAEYRSDDFTWLTTPVVNPFTRLIMEAAPASGALTVQGYEGVVPVTEPLRLP